MESSIDQNVVSFFLHLSLSTTMLAMLLLMAGDVERNPGPPPELGVLVTELKPVADQYSEIGVQLGIDPLYIRGIEERHSSNVDRCFSEALDFWLKGNTGVSVCWESIVTAVKNVGNNKLADELHRKYACAACEVVEISAASYRYPSEYGIGDSDMSALGVMSSSLESKLVELHKTRDPELIMKILKSIGSVPVADQVDSNGELPIHAYIKSSDKKKFECLMAYLIHAECTDLDHHNHEGMAALHLACDKDDDKSTKALIAFGANINSLTQNTQKQTPLDIILQKGGLKSKICEILTRIGGRRATVPSGGSFDPLELSGRLATMSGSRDKPHHHHSYLETKATEKKKAYETLHASKEMGILSAHIAEVNPSPPPNPRVKVQAEPLPQVDPSPPFEPSPPSKPKVPAMTRSLSTRNKAMEVTTSILGRSVRPRVKMEPHFPHLMTATNEVHTFGELVEKSKAIGQKVLCLDGGGIKGLVQLEILSAIEKATGKRITELFDWIVGTSTGGIIALGLVYAGLEVDDFRRVYFEMKDSVFKSQSMIIKNVCDSEALEELLIKTLGTDKKMDSVRSPKVMITAVDKSTTKLPLVFFNNCFDDKYSSEPVWKVARYTSAAPVFFTECDNYVDGGVVANNPAMRGMVEIQDYFEKQRSLGHNYKISCLVSIGCGGYFKEEIGNTNVTNLLSISQLVTNPKAVAHTLKHLFTLLTTALTQAEGDARTCFVSCVSQNIPYYRFSPEMFEDVGSAERDNIKLFDMIISTKEMLIQCSEQLKELAEDLGCKPVAERNPGTVTVAT